MTWTQKLAKGGEQDIWGQCADYKNEDSSSGEEFSLRMRMDSELGTSDQQLSRAEAGALAGAIVREGRAYVEPVIEGLIAELQRKNDAERCRETSIAITKLEEALLWQKSRMERKRAESDAAAA
ncbi:MAG: hypothetical protein KDB07_05330 [Planctomycetes bacterium]|nr:hypothetical protein [Planctomycetota bacterium]